MPSSIAAAVTEIPGSQAQQRHTRMPAWPRQQDGQAVDASQTSTGSLLPASYMLVQPSAAQLHALSACAAIRTASRTEARTAGGTPHGQAGCNLLHSFIRSSCDGQAAGWSAQVGADAGAGKAHGEAGNRPKHESDKCLLCMAAQIRGRMTLIVMGYPPSVHCANVTNEFASRTPPSSRCLVTSPSIIICPALTPHCQ